jgi:hypothetical protein
MDVTVHIPDDIAARLCAAGGDLSRFALKALAPEEYKNGHITKEELRRLLGFGTRCRLPAFSRLTTSLKITQWRTLSRSVKTCGTWVSDQQCGSSLATPD